MAVAVGLVTRFSRSIGVGAPRSSCTVVKPTTAVAMPANTTQAANEGRWRANQMKVAAPTREERADGAGRDQAPGNQAEYREGAQTLGTGKTLRASAVVSAGMNAIAVMPPNSFGWAGEPGAPPEYRSRARDHIAREKLENAGGTRNSRRQEPKCRCPLHMRGPRPGKHDRAEPEPENRQHDDANDHSRRLDRLRRPEGGVSTPPSAKRPMPRSSRPGTQIGISRRTVTMAAHARRKLNRKKTSEDGTCSPNTEVLRIPSRRIPA